MIGRYGLYFAWVIACLSMLGSLYFSEIEGLEPCHLCWYQRITIYPMVLILGIATYRNFRGIVPYVLPVLLIGFAISIYQVLIQEIPGWQPVELCGQGPSCTEKQIVYFGWLTIPMLSVLGFFFMIVFLLASWSRKET